MDNIMAKANPTFALLMQHLAIGFFFVMYAYFVVIKVFPPDGLQTLIVAALSGLGVYNVHSAGLLNSPKQPDTIKVITAPTQGEKIVNKT